MRRLIGAILIVEAAIAGLATLQSIPALAGYDAVAVVLILARAGVGALQFTSGLLLMEKRAPGGTLARLALFLSAVVTTMAVGFRWAPSDASAARRSMGGRSAARMRSTGAVCARSSGSGLKMLPERVPAA